MSGQWEVLGVQMAILARDMVYCCCKGLFFPPRGTHKYIYTDPLPMLKHNLRGLSPTAHHHQNLLTWHKALWWMAGPSRRLYTGALNYVLHSQIVVSEAFTGAAPTDRLRAGHITRYSYRRSICAMTCSNITATTKTGGVQIQVTVFHALYTRVKKPSVRLSPSCFMCSQLTSCRFWRSVSSLHSKGSCHLTHVPPVRRLPQGRQAVICFQSNRRPQVSPEKSPALQSRRRAAVCPAVGLIHNSDRISLRLWGGPAAGWVNGNAGLAVQRWMRGRMKIKFL